MSVSKRNSSCEMEDFVETHLCKLCVILLLSYFDRAYDGFYSTPHYTAPVIAYQYLVPGI